MTDIRVQPLTAAAFAPYGDVLDCKGAPDRIINAGLCGRFHDRAQMDMGDGRAGISLFRSELRALPYQLDLIERHPLGSQAFIPMSMDGFLVVVAGDDLVPQAFVTAPGEGINFHRGTWHGVLTPLAGPGLFAVIDRIGAGANLEEHHFAAPYRIIP
ncbi:ureidoglycolate lyase [Yoonia vestfoldensis]|jgi:ureidoglycolate lyase|uniref:Ureidoglycolate lyase n=1 Tax=Yoonia vestfoldensis TaxID=245188 RepID=A0A1Y0E7V8_9RHOB|nr:ureidoglycolate lyase [Yoonia vestfoldensis]ART99696.1 ureidoglycolate lyase [Yoonia vestfoldensis]